jgi:hypothetical protein
MEKLVLTRNENGQECILIDNAMSKNEEKMLELEKVNAIQTNMLTSDGKIVWLLYGKIG